MKQILVNLLTNAVKFTPDGGSIDVTARREPDALVIAVRDTGIGIAPEDHEAVFEEFRQVGRHYTNKQEGTGLGLTLTQEVRRAARRPDLGRKRAGQGLDVHLHDTRRGS